MTNPDTTAAVHAMVKFTLDRLAQRDAAIAKLREKVELLEVQLNAVERVKAMTDNATARVDQSDAKLDRVAALLEAVLEHYPAARKSAAARLRQ
jgi:hypothetical protein